MIKIPIIKCYNCHKPMIETYRNSFGDKDFGKTDIIRMNCIDYCVGQPELTLKDMGPFWDNITKENPDPDESKF